MRRAELDAMALKVRDLAAFVAWATARIQQGERGDRRTYELAMMVHCEGLDTNRLQTVARALLTFPVAE